MKKWFKKLDEILRGEATQTAKLREGEIDVPLGGLSAVIIILAAVYGLCMGSFAMIRTGGEAWKQFIASGIKFPLLFILTFLITFPSLYVFNALIGSRLRVGAALRLLMASIGIIQALAASLGPIVVFFSVSTTSYNFMILLNVLVCSIAGILGLYFLLRTLQRLVMIQSEPDEIEIPKKPLPSPPLPASLSNDESLMGKNISPPGFSPLDMVRHETNKRATRVFRVWVLVFALVGAQMSWVLRPFVGDPKLPFELFRVRESNFFIAVIQAIHSLFS